MSERPKFPSTAALDSELSALGSLDNVELLRGVLAGSGDCIKILDLQGRLQFMSEGGRRVMEVDDFAPLKGCPWPDFWVGQGNADATHAVRMALQGKPARFQGPANTAKGTPRYWDVQVAPILDASGRPSHILSMSRDITKERQATEHQTYLMEEMKHRVKNMLGVVLSLATQTFKGEQFQKPRAAFNERILALDHAHRTLNATDWRETSVRTIVENTLGGHAFKEGTISVEGPAVQLGAKQALALALAINELATNAFKYGSLKHPGGRIDVAWTVTSGTFAWTWQESGGAVVGPPTHAGFGSRVIKDMLAQEMRGTSEVTYDPAGLTCRLSAPVDCLLAQ